MASTITQRKENLTKAKAVLTEMALALIDNKFASIKFDTAEKTELADDIRNQFRMIDQVDTHDKHRFSDADVWNYLHYAEAGLRYATEEAPNLDKIPMGWLTNRDVDYILKERKAGHR